MIKSVFEQLKALFSRHQRDNPDSDNALSTSWMVVLALIVGVFGGIGSIIFRSIIGLVHNLAFYGELSFSYEPLQHIAPSSWGAGIILVPVIGSFVVTWIINTLAPEARGHGVPEVMNSIYYKGGHIRPVLVGAKAMASAISIGTGGSVGREGPIIQIGSAFASALSGLFTIPARQRVVLVSAGAAAGIAATFNAPICGLAFAMELLLVSISARTVSLVALATVTACYIGRLYDGILPSFPIAQFADLQQSHITDLYMLLMCVPLGILIGCSSTLFIHSIYWFEDKFTALFENTYLRHAVGMTLLGIIIYLFHLYAGHYYVAGVGYGTIIEILENLLTNPGLLLLLYLAKLLATGLTLGSGASGGIFSPSLYLGATLGAAFGQCAALLFPEANLSPAAFAIAGMAAMVSGTTGAVITAIAMTFEQTRNYDIILPIIIAVALSHTTRSRLTSETIYTLKLMRRGIIVPQGLQAAVSASRTAASIMVTNYEAIDLHNFDEWKATFKPGEGARQTVFIDNEEVCGVAKAELQYLMQDRDPEQVIDRNFLAVTTLTRWPVLMRAIRKTQAEHIVVFNRRHSTRAEDLVGVITAREILMAARDEMELVEN